MEIFIDTYGSYLHVKDNMFEIISSKDGNQERNLISPKKISSILISKGVSVSSDCIALALINNIDIIVLENDGTPIGRFWHSKLGSTTKIRKAQLIASMNKKSVEYVLKWISKKVNNQIDFLKYLRKNRSEKALFIDSQISSMIDNYEKMINLNANCIKEIADKIRGYEGTISRYYFDTLSDLLSKEYRFNGRSFRPANDPFNAFLNYAYGVLYSKVEKSLIIAGIDPYLGFMHRDDYNTLSMVYDFIEQFRIYADEVVFKLFSGKKVNKSHTNIIHNAYTLNKDGKKLLMEHYNKFLIEDKIRYNNRNVSRNTIIQLEAHNFAQELLNNSGVK